MQNKVYSQISRIKIKGLPSKFYELQINPTEISHKPFAFNVVSIKLWWSSNDVCLHTHHETFDFFRLNLFNPSENQTTLQASYELHWNLKFISWRQRDYFVVMVDFEYSSNKMITKTKFKWQWWSEKCLLVNKCQIPSFSFSPRSKELFITFRQKF